MAIREGQGRRVGRGPEKLITLEEAARRLGVPADDVEVLVRSGKIPSFRLGGSLLRVQLKDVDAITPRLADRRREIPPMVPAEQGEAALAPISFSWWEKWADFLYFHDFYIVAVLVALLLVAIIFTL